MKTLKNLFNPNKLSTLVFYLSILLFIIAFNFAHNPPSGWYQQFLPNIGGRSIVDLTFNDSLTGYIITSRLSFTDTSLILKSTDGGDNWFIIHADSGFIYKQIQFINENTGYVVGSDMIKTTNAGLNWFPINIPVPIDDISALNQDTIFTVYSEGLTGGVYRTTNGGASWIRQLHLGSQNPTNIYFYNKDTGYTAQNVLYKTTNSGLNWFEIPGGGFGDMHFINATTGWKCYGPIQKTTNGGNSWQTLPLPPKGGQIVLSRVIRFHNINADTIWGVGAVGIVPTGGRGFLYRTTDGGNIWGYQIPDTAIHSGQYQHIQFIDKRNGWAYSTTTGVHTKVGGDTTYFVGIKQIPNYIPERFTIKQNYPNPFNPTTSIPFELKESSYVILRVYDVRGIMVKELLNGGWSASKYVSEFDGTNLSSGIYFYRIEITGDNTKEKFTETKRMTMIK